MSETANLTIKLPLQLKERIKALAESNSVSMSAEIGARLERSLSEDSTPPKEHVAADVDNQHTQEITEQPFTSSEVKKLRALLNVAPKKKSKKK
ncbi:Arc family DNA-binding protein [Sodalis sp. dw_96]|uniref:Arc family DNA-binding protein n=1 Tax=Sodalis sp. dw_96 TaxID=2719794 RepID=UPI001BD2132B|nr:Arc family DNA-binding protein [Sodalis sp. dw_96]